MKIEYIILAAIVLVFVVDYFVRKRKKSTNEIEAKVNKDKASKETSSNKITFLIIILNVVITSVIIIFFEGSFFKRIYKLDLIYTAFYLETIHLYFINVIFLLNRRFFDYISRRPKNLILFSIFVFLTKLCLHYFLYRKHKSTNRLGEITYEEFVWHLENILTVEVKLFIPALASCLIISYLISDKIKAR